jgi:tetrahydroxynaphthalene reductase
VAPGAIKTDMYQAVAREYIPGGENFTDEQVDQVGWGPIFGNPSIFYYAHQDCN